MNTNLEIAQKLTDQALKIGADQSEAVVYTDEFSTTRFNNAIHQNIFIHNSGVYLTIIMEGNKIGTVSISSLEPKILEMGLKQALKTAKLAPPDPNFKSLPPNVKDKPVSGLYIGKTVSISQHEKGEYLRDLIDRGLSYDKRVESVAGYLANGFREVSISNSTGLARSTKFTNAELQVTVFSKEATSISSGYSSASDRDITKIDPDITISEASKSSIMSLNAKAVEPDIYEVVLKPYAASIIFSCLGDGFSTVSYREGRSFLAGCLGKQVLDEKLTVIDDGRDSRSLTAMPFDGEGTPKMKLTLIEQGVPKSICYDNYYALIDGRESTGHKPNKIDRMDGWVYQDPIPTNIFVKPGDSSEDELISDVKKGLLITRLHYVTVVDEKEVILSGMTRDGTWMIQNGEIKRPVKNMRFTDSMIKALSKIGAVGNQSTIKSSMREHAGLLSSSTTPSIKLDSFHFTGSTEF
jgi:predicted Zn-dependent protease